MYPITSTASSYNPSSLPSFLSSLWNKERETLLVEEVEISFEREPWLAIARKMAPFSNGAKPSAGDVSSRYFEVVKARGYQNCDLKLTVSEIERLEKLSYTIGFKPYLLAKMMCKHPDAIVDFIADLKKGRATCSYDEMRLALQEKKDSLKKEYHTCTMKFQNGEVVYYTYIAPYGSNSALPGNSSSETGNSSSSLPRKMNKASSKSSSKRNVEVLEIPQTAQKASRSALAAPMDASELFSKIVSLNKKENFKISEPLSEESFQSTSSSSKSTVLIEPLSSSFLSQQIRRSTSAVFSMKTSSLGKAKETILPMTTFENNSKEWASIPLEIEESCSNCLSLEDQIEKDILDSFGV